MSTCGCVHTYNSQRRAREAGSHGPWGNEGKGTRLTAGSWTINSSQWCGVPEQASFHMTLATARLGWCSWDGGHLWLPWLCGFGRELWGGAGDSTDEGDGAWQ